eukprot:TRINITY_DN66181_c2_g2_i1.p1 TRINITY_DN66181_c2_g2~~TRINITY_DN66181_c2_g2_i1.p1  ORF type:complete len:168 (+),score=7.59 TRINITY_DN66181_c2_g2_i1:216-719(+)
MEVSAPTSAVTLHPTTKEIKASPCDGTHQVGMGVWQVCGSQPRTLFPPHNHNMGTNQQLGINHQKYKEFYSKFHEIPSYDAWPQGQCTTVMTLDMVWGDQRAWHGCDCGKGRRREIMWFMHCISVYQHHQEGEEGRRKSCLVDLPQNLFVQVSCSLIFGACLCKKKH